MSTGQPQDASPPWQWPGTLVLKQENTEGKECKKVYTQKFIH